MWLTKDERQTIKELQSYTASHLDQEKTAEVLKKGAGLNRQKLDGGIERLFGKGLQPFVRAAPMERARFLLQHTDQPPETIAGAISYLDTKNFLTIYKRQLASLPAPNRNDWPAAEGSRGEGNEDGISGEGRSMMHSEQMLLIPGAIRWFASKACNMNWERGEK